MNDEPPVLQSAQRHLIQQKKLSGCDIRRSQLTHVKWRENSGQWEKNDNGETETRKPFYNTTSVMLCLGRD